MNRLAQLTNPFPMNYSHLEDAPLPAFGQVIRDQVLDFPRPKRVEVQHAIYRNLDWLFLVAHLRGSGSLSVSGVVFTMHALIALCKDSAL